jgi:3-oxoacyl-[acyl-carrier-protein] synthase-3
LLQITPEDCRGGSLFLDLNDQSIGITKLEVHLPGKYTSVQQAHLSPQAPSDENVWSIWKDTVIEYEHLTAFVAKQMEGWRSSEQDTACEFVTRTGIRGFYVAESESSSDMAVKVAERILEDCNKVDIDRIIFYHSTISQYPFWSTSCRIQHVLSLGSIPAMSISQKGGNALAMAVKVASETLAAEPHIRKILLVGSDKFIPPYDRTLRGLTAYGDSASAMVLEKSPQLFQILNVDVVDYAEWWNPCQFDAGANERMLEALAGHSASMLRRSLQAVNSSIDDLTLLIPPTFNRQFTDQIAQKCNLTGSRVYSKNLAITGPLMNSDMANNCLGAEREGLLPQGSMVAVLGLGLGTSLSCILMRRGAGEPAEQQAGSHLPVSLTHISYYLPPNPITVEDYAERVGLSTEQTQRYKDIHGLKTIHIGRGTGPFDFALEACQKILRESGVEPSSVDALIVHHTFFMLSFEPRTLVGQLQQALGLSRAIGFSVSGQACASVMVALMAARNMIWTKTAKRVLVVGADSCLGSDLAREIRDTSLLGEGASAVMVEANAGCNELLQVCNFVNGATFEMWNVIEKMQLSYFVGCIRAIRNVLTESSLSLDDIDLLIPHNINTSSWSVILPHIHCDSSKLFSKNIARRGHVCGSDLIINLTDIREEKRLQKGDRALLVTAGLGGGWGAAVLQI